MKATKGNKVYTIDETQKAMYQAQGYDIVGDDGKIVQYGAGKTVAYEEYKVLEEKVAKLEKENKKLKDEIKELKKGAQ
nr:MAG TPA: Thioester coiled coil peptide [Caudoviricetes sp.]